MSSLHHKILKNNRARLDNEDEESNEKFVMDGGK